MFVHRLMGLVEKSAAPSEEASTVYVLSGTHERRLRLHVMMSSSERQFSDREEVFE